MTYVKTLGLAVAMATALIAFAGLGTAAATVLCKVEGTGSPTGTRCPSGQAYTEIEIHAIRDPETAPIKTINTFKTIECQASTIVVNSPSEERESVGGSGGVLTFSDCNCEIAILEPGIMNIQWIPGTHNGTVVSSKMAETSTCQSVFGLVHCIIVSEKAELGTITGGNPATLDFESAGIPRLNTDSLCPNVMNWNGKYEVTTPKPLFVAGHT